MALRGVRAEINLLELEKLSMLHCSDRELAGWFGVDVKTIERRRKEPEFAAAMERGRCKGKINVRRMQMQLLEKGNATMAVWLGKQLLGQSDQADSATRQPTMLVIGDNGIRPVISAPKEPEGITIDLPPGCVELG